MNIHGDYFSPELAENQTLDNLEKFSLRLEEMYSKLKLMDQRRSVTSTKSSRTVDVTVPGCEEPNVAKRAKKAAKKTAKKKGKPGRPPKNG